MPSATFFAILASFGIVALASRQIGFAFSRARLPLITGFLLCGVLAGPYVLGLIPAAAVEELRFVDHLALAFIAFAAGSELYLTELKSRLKAIRWVTFGLIVCVFSSITATVLLVADYVPLLRELSPMARWAAALLAGSVLIARSPSSAIAVVNELRARGPFTRMMLGVTIVLDVVVIMLFSVTSSVADALLTDVGFDPRFVLLVLAEIVAAVIVGLVLGRLLPLLLARRMPDALQAGLLLTIGWGVFALSAWAREASHEQLPFEIFVEPLLACMVIGFTVTNFTPFRSDFRRLLDRTGPPVYVVFFTLTGAGLALDVVAATWQLALLLFGVRLLAVFVGSYLGGTIAGEPARLNRIAWMSFVTQAGVGLGLAKEVAVAFPAWGSGFAAMITAVIVLNQLLGPPVEKWAILRSGEARLKAGKRDLRGTPVAIIFGLEGQSVALARQLAGHGWKVKVATRKPDRVLAAEPGDIEIVAIADLSRAALEGIDAGAARAFVCLMSGVDNLEVAELAYEHFATRTVIVRSADRDHWKRFAALGAVPVDPSTALVSLLDHFVRSPAAAAMLLGLDQTQDVLDIEVENRDLHGLALRDLRLPLDTLVLSVRRRGANLISHGYTRLERGDRLSVLGSPKSLEEISRRLAA